MARKRKSVPKPEPSSEEEEEEQLQPQLPDEKSEEEYAGYSEEDEENEDDEEDNGKALSSSEEEEEEEEEEDDDDDDDDDGDEEEEEIEEPKRETIRKLLEPFGKDQLIDLLKEAALKSHSIVERLTAAAESDPVHRKIFIHGLGWDATSEILISAFEKYGEIEECNVVTDKLTGKSKGFGFLLFKTRAAARRALKEPQKKIGNRMTACQLASFGPVPNHPVPDATGRKIFVSNVGANVNPERLRDFFAKFGEIEEGPLGYDRITGKLRGFAIFVYKTTEGCKKALEEPSKYFEGCQLQCQRAVDGLKGSNKQVLNTNSGSTVLQPNDLALTYASASLMGLNPGLVGQNLNPAAAVVAGHNPAVGLLSPSLRAQLNQTGLSPSVGRGGSPSVARNAVTNSSPFPSGLGASYGEQSANNSINPSIIGSYGYQAALHGLGTYQGGQLGQASGAATASPAGSMVQPGFGSIGSYSSYLGR